LPKDDKWRSFPRVPQPPQNVSNQREYGRIIPNGKLIRESCHVTTTTDFEKRNQTAFFTTKLARDVLILWMFAQDTIGNQRAKPWTEGPKPGPQAVRVAGRHRIQKDESAQGEDAQCSPSQSTVQWR
jgi:hypothetical protein